MKPAFRFAQGRSLRRYRFVWMASLLWFVANSFASEAPRQVVRYEIDARLDASARAVLGREQITWVNDSTDTVRDLWFHLYLNAFKNEQSTFMRESGGQLRGDRVRKGEWGYVNVQRIRLKDGRDLKPTLRFVQPDDNNADDQTVMKVDLPEPVKPGASVTIDVEFYSKLPHVFARTGYHGNFYLVGQWFPKLGVYEKAGVRGRAQGGWNCHQFHANSEFYSDFGEYRVTLTVPSGFVVGATGVEKSRQANPSGTLTYRFEQDWIHDFAWTASTDFLRVERMFEAAKAVSPAELEQTAQRLGRTIDEVKLQDVKIILLTPREHARHVERYFRAAKAALKYFGLWYGKYPYPTLTLVDPPWGAGGAGGMEYPTLITVGARWLEPQSSLLLEGVTVHEFGHQYWYGMVASNEFEESWLDEGFNTYSTGKIVDLAYGADALPVRFLGVPFGWLVRPFRYFQNWVARTGWLAATKEDWVVRPAWQYSSALSYAVNSYPRTDAVLQTLEGQLGSPTFARVMRTYFERWKFRHPTTRDFMNVVNEVSGKNMDWFFDQHVFAANEVDYAVEKISCRRVERAAGIFEDAQGKPVEVTAEEVARDRRKQKGNGTYDVEIYVYRKGEAILPVDIEVTFENGEKVREQWDGAYRWTRLQYRKPAALKSVVVDPERKILLDVNFANNGRKWPGASEAGSGGVTVLKFFSKIFFWIQNLLWTLTSLV